MPTYFTPKSLKFLRALARHNERAWFQDHRDDYETHVREPFQRLLAGLQAPLAEVSAHYRADPAKVGGSLFRIHRDTRFANDKTPYKTWQGARLFHERSRQVPAPSFYVQLQPGNCFIGGGIWHPEPPVQRQIRQFIVDNPGGWQAAAHAPAFRRRFALDDADMLVRPPRGFPADFEYIDDLRHRNFVAWRGIEDDAMLGPRLLPTLVKDLQAMAPFMDYLCAALDLEF
ncbi:DUF2461 domain-containing protein [Luteimonas sp. M1R5S18]|uniref:DUF2461 domain-containing protein n=1 Tax=Luteimonas rhizosphaericola TaxID=3042024 RepID=A0ABT6JGT2_9GAMM|nr:DUF2461 domain-containing protein [Luteimonas rhizosphaericola]MDH5829897.1 DUF2461 domain-containing protein [Luteimonas rhizosphaericola]